MPGIMLLPISTHPEFPMQVQVQKEHEWLKRLVGEWTYESEASMAPGQPPTKMTGSEVVRSLGDVWVLCEAQGECPGEGIGYTLMTLGYDTAKKRFVGTFVGSMMSNLWIYDGALDSTGTKLVLDSEGPSFAGDGTMAKYQDTIEIKDANTRLLHSSFIGPDGKWQHFMTSTYRRVK
jgi:hypothetical protein